MRTRLYLCTLACSCLVGLGSCGHGDPIAADHQRTAEPQPWNSPQAGGAGAGWERRLEARTWKQSEYGRMP